MTVVTSDHTYFFDLVASARGGQPVYELAFTYPKEAKPRRGQDRPLASARTRPSLPRRATRRRSSIPPSSTLPGPARAIKKLLPARIYDDGNSTYLSWPAGTPVPAILVKDKQGTEGPVNFAVRGDVIVVEDVPRQIILRSGKQLATIDNHRAGAHAARARPARRGEEMKLAMRLAAKAAQRGPRSTRGRIRRDHRPRQPHRLSRGHPAQGQVRRARPCGRRRGRRRARHGDAVGHELALTRTRPAARPAPLPLQQPPVRLGVPPGAPLIAPCRRRPPRRSPSQVPGPAPVLAAPPQAAQAANPYNVADDRVRRQRAAGSGARRPRR